MPDLGSFTEVSSQSWFSRIGDSIKGILFGFLLCVVSVVILFWNEGRAVQTAKSLSEGAKATVAVSADEVQLTNENKLVHMTGEATTDDVLIDDEFQIEANAIRLERQVEMYQWREVQQQEEKKKLGGGKETTTTYSYEKQWSDSVVDSSGFHQKGRDSHQNPSSMPIRSQTLSADNVMLGAFKLTPAQQGKVKNDRDLPVSAKNIPASFAEQMQAQGKKLLYLGADPAAPQIGDCRIKFVATMPAEVSVVAQQVGDSFQPYQTKAGDKLSMLRMGIFDAEQMFTMAEDDNNNLTWILRGAGIAAMFAGFMLIFKPLSVLADVIPFLGDLVGMGMGLVAGLLTIAGSFLVIGFAWLFYRPLIGVPLLVVAIGCLVALFTRHSWAAKPASV